MSNENLVLPIVHLNGTSRKELVDLRCEFGRKLRDAVEALTAMSPNGRDYYPEPGRLEKATAQHKRRLDTLHALYVEIESEVLDLETEAE